MVAVVEERESIDAVGALKDDVERTDTTADDEDNASITADVDTRFVAVRLTTTAALTFKLLEAIWEATREFVEI